MKETRQRETGTRMIHVRIPDELHRRLRISAAEGDTTMQEWVAMVIKNELDRQDRDRDRTS